MIIKRLESMIIKRLEISASTLNQAAPATRAVYASVIVV
jgi:hypothetical protein